MSGSTLADDLESLQNLVKFGTVHEAEAQMVLVNQRKDPASIGPLLRLLDDHAEYEELMFSLIHSAESFDPVVYVAELLKVLHEVNEGSPAWAQTLFMRILNGPDGLRVLSELLGSSPPELLSVTKRVLERVIREEPKFRTRIEKILAGLGSAS